MESTTSLGIALRWRNKYGRRLYLQSEKVVSLSNYPLRALRLGKFLQIGIVGAGALGTEVTLRMARDVTLRHALGTVLVVDPDILSPENVSLSYLYSEAVAQHGSALLGTSKAGITAGFLNALSGTGSISRWIPHPVEIADVSWSHLRSLDLLISCTDNALARLETTLAARALGIPLLDAGVLGEAAEGGRLTFFSPHPDAACYLCGLTGQRRADLLSEASAVSLPCRLSPAASLGSNPVVSASLQRTANLLLEELHKFLTNV